MKRTSQVALLLMGVGAGGYAMMPRNECAAQPSTGMSAARAPGDPCPSGQSSSSSSSGGSSSRSSFSGSGSSDSSSHSGASHGGFGSTGASYSSGG